MNLVLLIALFFLSPLYGRGWELKIGENYLDSLVLSFRLGDYSIVNEGESVVVIVDGAYRQRCPLSPDLPVVREFIALAGKKAKLEFLSARFDSIRTGPVKRRGYPRRKSGNSWDWSINCAESNREPAFLSRLGSIRGVDIWMLEVRPFIETKDGLKILKQCQLKIITENPNDRPPKRFYSSYFHRIFEAILLNYDGAFAYDYGLPLVLFVGKAGYREFIRPLMMCEMKRGFDVVFAPIEEIGASVEALKSYISNAYFNWERPPVYVVVVGDVEDIPTNIVSDGESYATDLHYVAVDGEDFLPDMFIGRISISDTMELRAFVNKLISYELGELDSLYWLRHPMFISCGEDGLWELVLSTHRYAMENYFTTPRFEPETLYAIYGATGEDVLNGVRDGRLLLNYSGHGNTDGWGNPTVISSDVMMLSNWGKLPLVISNACLTARYNIPSCFGETWIRNAQGGAIGFIGASSYTYWDEDDIWERRFYDGIFLHSLYSLGEALVYANIELMRYGTPLDRYYFEVYNILGSPMFTLYLGLPDTLIVHHQSIYPAGLSSFPVRIESPPATVTLFSDTLPLFAGRTETGSIELVPSSTPEPPSLLQLTVNSSPFYLPYKAFIPVVYLGGFICVPGTLMLGVNSEISILAYDTLGLPIRNLNISLIGVMDTLFSTTDSTGIARIRFLPMFGEELHVIGRFYDGFVFADTSINIIGAIEPESLVIRTSADSIALFDTIPLGILTQIIVSANIDSFYVIIEQEGIREVSFTPDNFFVAPFSTERRGKVSVYFVKEGYNVKRRDFPVKAVSGIFEAIVVNSSTGEPVDSALVELFDSTGARRFFSIYTDSNGYCRASTPLPCERYLLSVRRFGFVLFNELVWLRARGILSVELEPLSQVSVFLDVRNERGENIPFRAYMFDTYDGTLRYTFHSSNGTELDFQIFAGNYKVNVYSLGYRNISSIVNIFSSPFELRFRAQRVSANVLVVDDGSGYSEQIRELLDECGYSAEICPFPNFLPPLDNYNLIFWLAGRNDEPVPEDVIPTLIDYVNAGGKILLEGGEIVFRLADDTLYPNLESELMHISRWETDNPGESLYISLQSAGSAFTFIPNILPNLASARRVTYSEYNYFDIMSANTGKFIYTMRNRRLGLGYIYGRSIGITGFAYPDAFVSPEIAQSIIVNMVYYLLFPFESLQAVVGLVRNRGGFPINEASVTLVNTERSYFSSTDMLGRFILNGIVPGNYELRVSSSGYRDTSFTIFVPPDSTTENLIVVLNDASNVLVQPLEGFFVSDFSPNPFNDGTLARLSAQSKEEVVVLLYDISGRICLRESLEIAGNTIYRLTLDRYSSGVYFVVFEFERGRIVKKVVLIK